ncbi:DUF3134 family protein [Planktothricoides raciborskii]|uniref:DUF3134 family protein n=1 Tax=Planktothricoides raciborskii TaxID=132608 RepID=UPI0018EF5ED1|nr:DUF3134 family protein [Planktothricoides raciborskii]
MRPVNKGDWPKDPKTNDSKVFTSDRKIEDNTYKEAKKDLICRLGPYCSYCETKLDISTSHVEHKLPKSLEKYYSLRGDWDNFLLACSPCNNAKSDKDIELDDVYWPDIDNTAWIFDYQFHQQKNGEEVVIIEVNSNLSQSQKEKAQITLELTGLNRYPGGPDEPRPADERYEHRTEAWNKAHRSLKLLQKLDDEEMRQDIVVQAKDKGFFSVWMTVFQDDPDMLERFMEEKAFPGTAREECFDEHGRPKPTISRPKSSTNVEPQPSYDSHISDDEPESLLEEEEETSTEPEAETPQPDAEFLPVDDSFRSEENSRSLFTRLIDAFSGNRQDYIGDRDELLSLEDSEPESEDFLSEESAESESPDEPETETEAIDSESESEDFLSEESAESESPDEPSAETEAIDSEPESEDFLSEESAESESPDEPETETEAIDSETKPEDSMETEAIDSEPEQPEATVNRQPQPTQTYSIPQQSPQYLETENDRKDKPVVNPSLTQTPRYQIADVIPLQYETSILDWLERSGRLMDRTSDNDENLLDSEEEIAELIENDGKYDDDDDDDILVDDD